VFIYIPEINGSPDNGVKVRKEDRRYISTDYKNDKEIGCFELSNLDPKISILFFPIFQINFLDINFSFFNLAKSSFFFSRDHIKEICIK